MSRRNSHGPAAGGLGGLGATGLLATAGLMFLGACGDVAMNEVSDGGSGGMLVSSTTAMGGGGADGTGGHGGQGSPICGDGIGEGDEGCDDSNTVDGDGCSANCEVEMGFACQGSDPSVCLESWSIDLFDWVADFVAAAPGSGSDGFEAPTPAQLTAFVQAVDAALAEDWVGLKDQLPATGYRAVFIQDTAGGDEQLVGLVPMPFGPTQFSGGAGAGVYIVRQQQDVARDLILEASHIRFDGRPGHVATLAFRELGARALSLSGTHRCANPQDSPCSGSTGVCGEPSQPYRTSDMAHVTGTFFQAFHEQSHLRTTALIVQVHGMATDAALASISDGTSNDVDDDRHISNRLAAAIELEASLLGSSVPANSCNRIGDANLLCGGTNTQGRFSNGVDAALTCTTGSGGVVSGRFVHAELSPELRNFSSPIGPAAFVNGLRTALP